MTLEEFIRMIDETAPPAPPDQIAALEHTLGVSLPEDYRQFLIGCNGGYLGGALWFTGPTPTGEAADAGVHHIGGFRSEGSFSLPWHRDCYSGRIPGALMWIMDDPFGNAICLGVRGEHYGHIYFWDHEAEPDPARWNGEVETASNISLIANSFAEFVAGLKPVA